jgi:ERCC4-type nuclease
MNLTIDCREAKLLEELAKLKAPETSLFKDVNITTANLLLGDIQIQVHEKHKILIERKTVDDLLASIKDGRYDEQSYRLQAITDYKVFYLIEGKIKSNHRVVFSSLLSLNYFKGFSILRTDDIKETASMILYFMLKLEKEKEKIQHLALGGGVVPAEDIYPSLIQKKKNDNITESNFAEIVLCQIPLVSHVYASAIMSRYNQDLNALLLAIKTDPTCLDNITHMNPKTNKERKISKTCVANIFKFLGERKVS